MSNTIGYYNNIDDLLKVLSSEFVDTLEGKDVPNRMAAVSAQQGKSFAKYINTNIRDNVKSLLMELNSGPLASIGWETKIAYDKATNEVYIYPGEKNAKSVPSWDTIRRNSFHFNLTNTFGLGQNLGKNQLSVASNVVDFKEVGGQLHFEIINAITSAMKQMVHLTNNTKTGKRAILSRDLERISWGFKKANEINRQLNSPVSSPSTSHIGVQSSQIKVAAIENYLIQYRNVIADTLKQADSQYTNLNTEQIVEKVRKEIMSTAVYINKMKLKGEKATITYESLLNKKLGNVINNIPEMKKLEQAVVDFFTTVDFNTELLSEDVLLGNSTFATVNEALFPLGSLITGRTVDQSNRAGGRRKSKINPSTTRAIYAGITGQNKKRFQLMNDVDLLGKGKVAQVKERGDMATYGVMSLSNKELSDYFKQFKESEWKSYKTKSKIKGRRARAAFEKKFAKQYGNGDYSLSNGGAIVAEGLIKETQQVRDLIPITLSNQELRTFISKILRDQITRRYRQDNIDTKNLKQDLSALTIEEIWNNYQPFLDNSSIEKDLVAYLRKKTNRKWQQDESLTATDSSTGNSVSMSTLSSFINSLSAGNDIVFQGSEIVNSQNAKLNIGAGIKVNPILTSDDFIDFINQQQGHGAHNRASIIIGDEGSTARKLYEIPGVFSYLMATASNQIMASGGITTSEGKAVVNKINQGLKKILPGTADDLVYWDEEAGGLNWNGEFDLVKTIQNYIHTSGKNTDVGKTTLRALNEINKAVQGDLKFNEDFSDITNIKDIVLGSTISFASDIDYSGFSRNDSLNARLDLRMLESLERVYGKDSQVATKARARYDHSIDQLHKAQDKIKDIYQMQDKVRDEDVVINANALTQYDNFDWGTDDFDDNNNLTEAAFKKSLWGYIWEAKQQKAAALGINPEDVKAYIDFSDEGGLISSHKYDKDYAAGSRFLEIAGMDKPITIKDGIVSNLDPYALERNNILTNKNLDINEKYNRLAVLDYNNSHNGSLFEQYSAVPLSSSGYLKSTVVTEDFDNLNRIHMNSLDIKDLLRTLSLQKLQALANDLGGPGDYKNKGYTIQSILKYIDPSSSLFKNKGISSNLFRYPFFTGTAAQMGEIVVDDKVLEKQIGISNAFLKILNGDVDGDRLLTVLSDAFLSGVNDEPGSVEDFKRQLVEDRKLSAITNSTLQDIETLEGGKAPKQRAPLAEQINTNLSDLSKNLNGYITALNKGEVGISSNMTTAFRMATSGRSKDPNKNFALRIDETSLDANSTEAQKNLAFDTILMRSFLSSTEQNAISAKKTIDYLTKQGKINDYLQDPEGALSEVLEGLHRYNESAKDVRYFDKNAVIDRIRMGQEELGFIGGDEEGLFGGAYLATILQQARNANIVKSVANRFKKRGSDGSLSALDDTDISILEGGKHGSAEYKDLIRSLILDRDSMADAMINIDAEFRKNPAKAGYHGLADILNPLLYTSQIGSKAEATKEDVAYRFRYSLDSALDKNTESAKRYRQQLDDTKQAVDAERIAEERKIGVATREGKAIDQLASKYQNYLEVVNEAGDAVTAILSKGVPNAWQTATGKVKKIFPYDPFPENALGQRVYELLGSRDEKGAFKYDSLEAIYKDQENEITKENEKAILAQLNGMVAQQGTNIHGLTQARSYIALAGVDVSNIKNIKQLLAFFDELSKEISTYDLNNLSAEQLTKYTLWEQLNAKKSFADGTQGSSLIEEIKAANHVYESLGGNFIKTWEDSVRTGFNASEYLSKGINGVQGGKLLGQEIGTVGIDLNRKARQGYIDYLYTHKQKNPYSGKDETILTVGDIKHLSKDKKIQDKDLIQIAEYAANLEQAQAYIQKQKSSNPNYGASDFWGEKGSFGEAIKALNGGKEVEGLFEALSDPEMKTRLELLYYGSKGNVLTFRSSAQELAKHKDIFSRLEALKASKNPADIDNNYEGGRSAYEADMKTLKSVFSIGDKMYNEYEENLDVKNNYLKLLKEEIQLKEVIKKINYEISSSEKGSPEEKLLKSKLKDLKKQLQYLKLIDEQYKESYGFQHLSAEDKKDFNEQKKKMNADAKNEVDKYLQERQQVFTNDYLSLQNENLKAAQGILSIESKLKHTKNPAESKLLEFQKQDYENIIAKNNEILSGRDWEAAVGGAENFANLQNTIATNFQKAALEQKLLEKQMNPTIWSSMSKSVKGYFNQLSSGGLVWMVLSRVTKGLQQVIQGAQKLDIVMTNLRIVTGDNYETSENLMNSYSKLGKQLSASTSEIASAANDWLRQGYSVAETNNLISASMHLSKLGMIESGEATKYLTSMLKGFKMEASEAMDVVDKLTKVDMVAATSAGDIASSLQNFATTAQLSGLDIDQSIAMATTIMDVSQKDASSVGNALKTMMSRYGNVKAGAFSNLILSEEGDADSTESLNDIEKILNKLGISMRNTNLEFRDFDEVLEEIGDSWDKYDNVTKNAIATAMAGTRQRESFLVLMENMDKYHDLIETSKDSKGTAEEKFLTYQESMVAAQKELAASWENLALNSDINRFMTLGLKFATVIVDNMPNLLRWASRLAVIFNAYKMPTFINKMGKFFAFNNGEQGGSSIRGWQGLKSKYNAQKFYNNRINQPSTIEMLVDELRKITNYINTNVSALNQNTAAIKGEKVSQGQSASDLGQIPSDKNSQKNLIKQNKDFLVGGAAAGIMGGLTGFATARTTHTNASGEEVNNSEKAQTASTAINTVTGAISGIASMFGPWGMLASIFISGIGEVLGFWLPQLIDAEKDAREERVKWDENNLEYLKQISDNTAELKQYNNTQHLTYEENKVMLEKFDELIATVVNSDNKEFSEKMWQQLIKVAGGDIASGVFTYKGQEFDNIASFLSYYKNADIEDRKELYRMLQIAIGTASADSLAGSHENDLVEWEKNLKKNQYKSVIRANELFQDRDGNYVESKYVSLGQDEKVLNDYAKDSYGDHSSLWKLKEQYDNFVQWAEKNNYKLKTVNKDFKSGTSSQEYTYLALDSDDMEENIKFLEAYLATLQEGSEEWDEIRNKINGLKKAYADLTNIYQDYNNQVARNAVLTAKNAEGNFLIDLSEYDLSKYSQTEIREMVEDAIRKQGGYKGIRIDSDKGKAITESVIKSDEVLYNVYSGRSYTLNQALQLKDNIDILRQFSTALNVPIEQLEEMGEVIGDLKLGDLLDGLESIRTKTEELYSLFKDLTESSGLSANNFESILQKYPELVPFLGDTRIFTTELLKKINSLQTVYSRGVMSELLGSSGLFSYFKESLSDSAKEGLFSTSGHYKNAKKMSELTPLLSEGGSLSDEELKSKYNLTREQFDEIYKKYIEMYTTSYQDILQQSILDQQAEYLSTLYDKQIDNLEEQKSQLSEINKEREYENKLIEAKLKLENAQKEKKRVWREGIGWTYETDQSSVKAAQEELDSLNTEKQVEELSAQITQLEAEKKSLNDIKTDASFEKMSDSFEAWKDSLGGMFDSQSELVSTLENLYNNISLKTNPEGAAADASKAELEMYNSIFGDENSLWADVVAARKAITKPDNMSEEEWTKYKASDEYRQAESNYNDAVGAYQSAVHSYQNSYGQAASDRLTGLKEGSETDQQKYTTGMSGTKSNEYIPSFEFGGKRYKVDNRVDKFDNTMGDWVDTANTKNNEDLMQYASLDPSKSSFNELEWKTMKDSELNNLGEGGSSSIIKYLENIGAPSGTLVRQRGSGNQMVFLTPSDLSNIKGHENDSAGLYKFSSFKKGTLNTPGGISLINELGSEAIVTPNGTITALPASSGVVPADITTNLWQLGEISPIIEKWILRQSGQSSFNSWNNPNTVDNSVSIDSLTMNISADQAFDMDSFITQLRTVSSLNKNNKR